MVNNTPIVVVHWPRLGPYHLARLEAAAGLFAHMGYQIAALEMFNQGDDYLWESIEQIQGFKHFTIFPHTKPENVSKSLMVRRIWKNLGTINPCAVAINGYSSWDTMCILLWCRLHDRFPILMSESKLDDAPRTYVREHIKEMIVGQFGAALCGGRPHREYLLNLHMPADRIFDGYDAVNNQFFMHHADQVRQSPDDYNLLPGLENRHPFFLASGRFIPRKNYLGLIKAYQLYKQHCYQSNHHPWRLVILGDGPQRQTLLDVIIQNQLQSDITLAGVRTINELPAYYGLAKAFIHPPFQEQWGLVVNEAMASGLPVLVSAATGCVVDLVQDGVEGFIFDPTDAAELADLMYKSCFTQVDLRKMGQAAREKIKLWGVERFARNLLQAVVTGVERMP